METAFKKLTVKTSINAPVSKVWEIYNAPEHITKWNTPHPDWHSPSSTNDLRPGGSFSTRMEAKDGSFGFDFAGVYDDVKTNELISYTMSDGRTVQTTFQAKGNTTDIVTVFDAENENSLEMQEQGWQAILDSFKKYTEAY